MKKTEIELAKAKRLKDKILSFNILNDDEIELIDAVFESAKSYIVNIEKQKEKLKNYYPNELHKLNCKIRYAKASNNGYKLQLLKEQKKKLIERFKE